MEACARAPPARARAAPTALTSSPASTLTHRSAWLAAPASPLRESMCAVTEKCRHSCGWSSSRWATLAVARTPLPLERIDVVEGHERRARGADADRPHELRACGTGKVGRTDVHGSAVLQARSEPAHLPG